MKPSKSLLFIFASLLFFYSSACKHVSLKPEREVANGDRSLLKRDISMIIVPENKHTPAYINFEQKERFLFGAMLNTSGYKLETAVDPLMRNFSMKARVEKNGKVLREFAAKKNATSVLSDKKNTWSPARSKMVITIPYLAEGEEVVVKTSYEWMDIRWMPPIFLQEDIKGALSTLTIDVAYGVTMHFKATKDRLAYQFIPDSEPHENKLWIDQDNKAGLGLRYSFKSAPTEQSKSSIKADQLQVYLAFEAPSRNEVASRFDSWSAVASYLYNRIDRYDMPSTEVKAFAIEKTKNATSDKEKIDIIFSFLRTDIEKRSAVTLFNEQPVQPATRTFARRYGSAFDLVILGQAMLSSVGLNSNMLLSADARYNPKINDFYSPALLSSPILAVTTSAQTYYFDPESDKNSPELNKNLQGQIALALKPLKGEFFNLPYDNAQKHGHTQTYQLWLNDNDALEGEYSVDLSGFDAQGFHLEPGMTDPQILETKLREKSELPFSLATAEVIKTANSQSARFYGEIKPALLSKNSDNTLDLKLLKIIAPLVNAIKSANQRGYSFTQKISFILNLPPKMVAKNIPASVNIASDGIQGRISIANLGTELIIEGIAMVSLPLNLSSDKLNESLKNLVAFGEQSMSLGSDTALGELNDRKDLDPKNP